MTRDEVLAALHTIQEELNELRRVAAGDAELAWEKLERWKERAVTFLGAHVSEREATSLREKEGAVALDDPFRSVTDAIDAYDRYLTALVDDLAAGHEVPTDRTPAEVRRELSYLQLHPRVIEVAGRLFGQGNYREALLNAFIALGEAVQAKSTLAVKDTTPLMQQAFSQKTPKLRVSTDADEQLGFMWLFSGAVMGLRNPNAHRLRPHEDPSRTLEWLCFASALFRVLDASEVVP